MGAASAPFSQTRIPCTSPELLELARMGTAAAILGKSLYTGALDLARCVELVQQ